MQTNVRDLSKNILYNALVQPHDILCIDVAYAKLSFVCFSNWRGFSQS